MGERNRFYDRNLDNEAVDRIIAATRLDCSIADREELSIDLPSVRAIYVSLWREYAHSARKRQTAKLNKIIKLVEELQRCLNDGEIGREVLMQLKANPREILKRLASTAKALLPDNRPPQIEERFVKQITNRSEFENLAGLALPNIFKRRFHQTPGISRNSKTQEPDGPFIRFAHQALYKERQAVLARDDSQSFYVGSQRTDTAQFLAPWAKSDSILESAQRPRPL